MEILIIILAALAILPIPVLTLMYLIHSVKLNIKHDRVYTCTIHLPHMVIISPKVKKEDSESKHMQWS